MILQFSRIVHYILFIFCLYVIFCAGSGLFWSYEADSQGSVETYSKPRTSSQANLKCLPPASALRWKPQKKRNEKRFLNFIESANILGTITQVTYFDSKWHMDTYILVKYAFKIRNVDNKVKKQNICIELFYVWHANHVLAKSNTIQPKPSSKQQPPWNGCFHITVQLGFPQNLCKVRLSVFSLLRMWTLQMRGLWDMTKGRLNENFTNLHWTFPLHPIATVITSRQKYRFKYRYKYGWKCRYQDQIQTHI